MVDTTWTVVGNAAPGKHRESRLAVKCNGCDETFVRRTDYIRSRRSSSCPSCRGKQVAEKSKSVGKHCECPGPRGRGNSMCQSCYSRFAKYGMLPDRYFELLELQAGLCAVCCEPMMSHRDTQVDHDHNTGEVRALCCVGCNGGFKIKDDALLCESRAAYLRLYELQ